MRLHGFYITIISMLLGIVSGQTDSTQVKKTMVSKKEVKAADKASLEVEQTEILQPVEPSGVEVIRAAVCLGIDRREPQEIAEKFSKDVGKLCCFSHIKSGGKRLNIVHKWYHKYKLISSIALRVKGDNWRTYSYKTIAPDMVGEWKVEIVNSENDEVLQLLKFLVE